MTQWQRVLLTYEPGTISLPDALQISVALSAGCDAFLTNDVKLKRLTELRVLAIDELEI
jgi:predicted nucleic acid-binding protein